MAEQRKRRAGRGKRPAQKRRDARLDAQAGAALAHWRKTHDPPLLQEDLAVVLGCRRETISRFETGQQPLKLRELLRIAQEYQTTLEAILDWSWDRPWRPPPVRRRRARGKRR